MKRNVQWRLKSGRRRMEMKFVWSSKCHSLATISELPSSDCKTAASHLELRKQNILADQSDGVGTSVEFHLCRCAPSITSLSDWEAKRKAASISLAVEAIEKLNFNFRSLIEKVVPLIGLRVFISRVAINQPCEGRFGTQKRLRSCGGNVLREIN